MDTLMNAQAKQTVIELDVAVGQIIKRTHNVKSFRFKVDDRADFKPGQYIILTLRENRKLSKALSISNSPTERGYIEVTKKLTDSDYSRELDNLIVGDTVKIRYPMGKFTFEGEYPKVVFLCGGIGITPMRSICKYITDKNIPVDMVLVYGNKSIYDRAFIDDFEAMRQQNHLFDLIEVLAEAGNGWAGHKGLINAPIIKQEIPDYNERVFYICGPQAMVEAMRGFLKTELNVPENKVVFESFAGY